MVLESTILASPQVTLQVFILAFAPTADTTRGLWKILVESGLLKDGADYLKPKLSF